MDFWEGKHALEDEELRGNLRIELDKWYGVLIAVHQEGEFLVLVWELNDPTYRAIYHETINDKWMGNSWELLLRANSGTQITIDKYYLYAFSTIQ